MNIKVIQYELHHQTDDSKPFVLYTIQIENRKKQKQQQKVLIGDGDTAKTTLENAELSGDIVPLNYSSPYDREYKYSYVEEFDDEFSETNSSSNNLSSSPNRQNHEEETEEMICEFMKNSDWTVTKRYSEMYDYHQRFVEICSQNSRDIKTLFPKKLIIGNLKKENIEKRIEQFNEYFKRMVDVILKEENVELQKLVSHFFSSKPLVSSESNPSKHPNKNIDWMIHKPNSRNNWFFSAPLGFEKFSTSFDRRAEYISPIFQNISVETLIKIWEMFISKQGKIELVDSNHDIYLYTYRQKSSFINNDFITVQFLQEIPPKITETNSNENTEVTPSKNDDILDDNLSNMSPPNFESNVGDILKRFSIRRTIEFDFRDLMSGSSEDPFEDTQSIEETRKPKFSIVLYSRSKIDLKDTNEKRVKTWLNDFKKLVMKQAPTVQLCNSFQWE